MNKRTTHLVATGLFLLAISLLFCFPYFNGALGVPQDLRFHLNRILGMSNVWHSPVNFLTYAHRGNMVAPYYPWLTLYPAYLLFKITGSLAVAYKLYMLGVVFLTAVSAYACFNSLSKNATQSTLFATLYTFASYHALNTFLRGAVGEVVCAAFLPIAFLGLHAVLKGNWRRWPFLAIGMTGLLYTHLLSLAITTALMVILTLLALPGMQDRGQRLLAGIVAAITTGLLSLGFILPFLQMSRAQKVALPVAHLLERGTVPPAQLISDMLNNNWGAYGLGLIVLVALVGSLLKWQELATWERGLLGLSLVMVLMLTTLFPIARFNGTLLNELQFIWRLNAFTTLFVLAVFCRHLGPITVSWRSGLGLLVLVGALTSIHYTSYHAVRSSQMYFPAGEGLVYHAGTAEKQTRAYPHSDYRPEDALNPAYVEDFRPRLRGKVMPVKSRYTADTATYTVTNHGKAGVLRTSAYRYSSALVTLNGKPVGTTNVDGLTGVRIPHGKSTITITYRNSRLTSIARAISALTLLLLLALPVYRQRQRRTATPKKHQA